ncbi:MAG: hypothetical protein H7Y20_06920, partial [Bryobacteraceae bacterium]|nr:hypothetical protein [Bryobacteraceae bacterium]
MRNSTDLAAAVESVVRVFLKMAGGVSPPAPQMKSALVLLSLFLAACSTPTAVRPAAEPKPEKAKIKQPSPYDSEFWKTWSDGQAEVAAYDLIMPKYGQLRRGTAIAITVAESFSKSAMVKADPGKHASSDVFAAIKLNLIRSYQTGIYNYKDMLSAFVALDEVNGRVPGMAAKITYSSQEWCGQVFSELLFSGSTVHQTRHSYFDGEADMQRSLQNAEEALAEDTVMLVARRIGWPRLRLGQRYETQMLTSLEAERSHHERVSYVPAAFTLAKERQTTTVPA